MIGRKAPVLVLAAFCLWGGCQKSQAPASPSTTEAAPKAPEPAPATSPAPAATADAATDLKPGERIEVVAEDFFDGTPKSRQEMKVDAEGNQIPHGVLTLWWEDGKTKKLEMRFKDGKAVGLKTAWFRDGKKWSEGMYVDGKEDGMWTVWYPDGIKQHELPMRNGGFHGIETQWHQNGQKRMHGEWVNGKQKGFFTYWDPNGKLAKEIDYGNPQP